MLECRNIHKHYGGVAALKGVSWKLLPGEVHALMGQNGAGKSTLIKVLTGVHPADQGEIVLGGTPIRPATPIEAQRLGISTVYQEVNLCANLSVAENIFAGRYPRRGAAALWRIREDGAGLGGRTPAGTPAWPGWEDSAVPPQALGPY